MVMGIRKAESNRANMERKVMTRGKRNIVMHSILEKGRADLERSADSCMKKETMEAKESCLGSHLSKKS